MVHVVITSCKQSFDFKCVYIYNVYIIRTMFMQFVRRKENDNNKTIKKHKSRQARPVKKERERERH